MTPTTLPRLSAPPRGGALAAAACALACSVAPPPAGARMVEASPAAPALAVVVSLPPQAWLVRAIGGDRVAVRALVGPGASEETYAPGDAEVTAALLARVLFRTGAPFEEAPWFRALAATDGLELVDVRAGAESSGAATPHHHESAADPHVWLSARSLQGQARVVAATLARVDPAGSAAYDAGLAAVLAELRSLDRELGEILAPYRGRPFFVAHPSWGRLAADYGLEQVAIEEEGKEPTDHDLTRVLATAREERPRFVIADRRSSDRSAAAVAAALGAEVVRLDPLSSDVPGVLRAAARWIAEGLAP